MRLSCQSGTTFPRIVIPLYVPDHALTVIIH
jgi:hypothetical protein